MPGYDSPSTTSKLRSPYTSPVSYPKPYSPASKHSEKKPGGYPLFDKTTLELQKKIAAAQQDIAVQKKEVATLTQENAELLKKANKLVDENIARLNSLPVTTAAVALSSTRRPMTYPGCDLAYSPPREHNRFLPRQ